MAKRLIAPQPPPRITLEKKLAAKAAKEAIDAMAVAANAIPGVTAFPVGDAIKVRISGNSFSEIAQKIMQLPAELQNTPAKTICDGEPIQITSIQGPMITPAGFGTFEARPRKT
jgi:hypothetical protein